MIDRERLEELRHEIGEEDFTEVAIMFLDEMAETLGALCSDPGSVRADHFHGLRGSALNLGFTAFATACSEAEDRVRGGQPIDMTGLGRLFRQSVAAFGPELPAAAYGVIPQRGGPRSADHRHRPRHTRWPAS